MNAAALLARAAIAEARVRPIRAAGVRDLLTPDAARLDDRRRAALRTLLRAVVATIGADIQEQATRLLTQAGDEDALYAIDKVELLHIMPGVERRLGEDVATGADLIERVSLDVIGEALPPGLVDGEEPLTLSAPSRALEPRLATLRAAEGRRRVAPDQPPYATDLPRESHTRFVWWVAGATARETRAASADSRSAIDRALASAAERVLAQHEEGERLEIAAIRVASLLDARGAELAELIDHCIAHRRIVLLAASLGQALDIDYESARALLIDPSGTPLWVALRALELPRETVARLGYALSVADHRRHEEQFADMLDAIMGVDVAEAQRAVAPLRLPAPFRAALGEPEYLR